MITIQKEIKLAAHDRGFHLITQKVVDSIPELSEIDTGVLQIFIQHTSASLALNENADPTVRADLENYFDRSVPENASYFQHTLEGSDDMPAHIKAILIGPTLSIPITRGKLNLGTWQGIYLCEHRNYGGSRKLVLTAWGN